MAYLKYAIPMILCLAFAVSSAEALVQSRKPLPYRIISFHRGRADKELIKRAAELGYNGVMIQLEHGNVEPLKVFAEQDRQEQYVKFCHGLGMEITLWVHELSDIPGEDDPNYLGPVSPDNEKLWKYIADRYEWLFSELMPDIDGIVLTVSETQIWATDTDLMKRIVGVLQEKCDKYGKKLIVRTFVHTTDQFESVMKCVDQLPEDTIIMSKTVPQDWHLRGVHNPSIGAVGAKDQIIEYDIAGEYFLMDAVANCFPETLKRYLDYEIAHGTDGICVRVDRHSAQVLHQPAEINLWALGMLASGKTDSVDEVWQAWATARYGDEVADDIIRILKPTAKVVQEALCAGNFTFGNGRDFLVFHNSPNGDEDAWDMPWSPARWDKRFESEYQQLISGDPRVLRSQQVAKRSAMRLADRSLAGLEEIKEQLHPRDYEILKTKLTTNKVQLEFRGAMMIAYLRYRRILNTDDPAEKARMARGIGKELEVIRSSAGRVYPPAREIEHLGRKWRVGPPEFVNWERVRSWADRMEELLRKQGL